jgi:hypothetical protein
MSVKPVRKFNRFGRLAACGDPRLCLLLYELFLHDPEIDAAIEIRGQMPQLSPATLEAVASKLADFCERLRQLGPCQVMVTLKGDNKPCIEMQIVGTQIPGGFLDCAGIPKL